MYYGSVYVMVSCENKRRLLVLKHS